jgi:hypothetical protein
MMQPLITAGINIVLRAERSFVQSALGALVDDGALVAREGSTVFLFEKILTDLGANLFENKADMCRQRIVAQDGVPGLEGRSRVPITANAANAISGIAKKIDPDQNSNAASRTAVISRTAV